MACRGLSGPDLIGRFVKLGLAGWTLGRRQAAVWSEETQAIGRSYIRTAVQQLHFVCLSLRLRPNHRHFIKEEKHQPSHTQRTQHFELDKWIWLSNESRSVQDSPQQPRKHERQTTTPRENLLLWNVLVKRLHFWCFPYTREHFPRVVEPQWRFKCESELQVSIVMTTRWGAPTLRLADSLVFSLPSRALRNGQLDVGLARLYMPFQTKTLEVSKTIDE